MRRGVGARLGAAVAVLVVVALGAADAGLSINSSAPPAPHADDLLSKAERVASKAESFVKANQRLLSAVGGSVLLLHGQAFSTSILFMQSFRSAGLPIVTRGWDKLATNYQEARQVYEREKPNIIKSKELLPKLATEAQETMQVLRDAQTEFKQAEKTSRAAQQGLQRAQKALERIQERAKQQPTATELQMELGTLKKDKEEADKLVARVKAQLASAQALRDRAQQQYADANKIYGQALSSVSSARAIADAVNPENVQEILQGMAGGVLSCVAATRVPIAGTALVGADLGTLVTDKLRPVLRGVVDRTRDGLLPMGASEMPPSLSKWVDTSLSSACTAAGLFATLKAREVVQTAWASIIGAHMVTRAMTETLRDVSGTDLYAVNLTLPALSVPLPSGHSLATKACSLSAGRVFENTLVVASLVTQIVHRSTPLPAPLQVVLAPFIAFEAWLKIASAGGKVKV